MDKNEILVWLGQQQPFGPEFPLQDVRVIGRFKTENEDEGEALLIETHSNLRC